MISGESIEELFVILQLACWITCLIASRVKLAVIPGSRACDWHMPL